jgi:CRISPR-associated endonuclease/helicase Cas3
LNQAKCYILPCNEGSEAVYGTEVLKLTEVNIPDKLILPNDIPHLVDAVYSALKEDQTAKSKAEVGQLTSPLIKDSIIGILENKSVDSGSSQAQTKYAEAAVRDIEPSLEVCLIQRDAGKLYTLPRQGLERISANRVPCEKVARKVAGSAIRLPAVFSRKWLAHSVLAELELRMSKALDTTQWYKSTWLRGELCLILDDKLETVLAGYRIRYSKELGLTYEKEGL